MHMASNGPVVTHVNICAVRDIGDISAEILGAKPFDDAPLTFPLLLFGQFEKDVKTHLYIDDRCLVQESLSISLSAPVGNEWSFQIAPVATTDDRGTTILKVSLSHVSGGRICDVRAALRRESVDRLMVAAMPFDLAGRGFEMRDPCVTPPIDENYVDRYLKLVGDDNPIHAAVRRGVSAELPAAIVPGGLIAMIAEAALRRAFHGASLVQMNMRFTSPIFVGDRLRIYVQKRESDVRRARGVMCNEAGGLVAACDVVVAESGSA